MADTKDATQKDPPIPFPLLAAAYLLFCCLEGILAVEVRSVSFFLPASSSSKRLP
jgi:hypothetical protein